MTQTYFPFDSGQGANVTESQWSKMAQYWLGTGVLKGVLNELLVYADSTGMQVKVKSGRSWIQGHFFESDAEEILPINTANATNPRIDRIILRLDWNVNTIQLAVLQGTPATSPSVPALTKNTSRWEIPLAQIRVNAGATTIASANVTDERVYSQQPYVTSQNYGQSFDVLTASFAVYTGDTASTLRLTVTFPEAYSSPPSVFPGNITQTISFCDTMAFPMISSVTTTSFEVELNLTNSADNFGVGVLKMNFLIFGK